MSKKVITEISTTEFNETTGKYEVTSKQQVAVVATEDKFFKFYYDGLVYISDMPLECHRVLYALLDNMTYVDQTVEGLGNYGMHIFLNKKIKEGIAEKLGLGNSRTIDNTIQKLLKGEVLFRVCKGVYRPNPYIVCRGAWKEIQHLRAECGYAFADGDTFKTVCARKDAVKKQLAEVAAEQAKHQNVQPVQAEATEDAEAAE